MKMRLRPLRGQTYETEEGCKVKFLTTSNGNTIAHVIAPDGYSDRIPMDHLLLPIIDTKDYEKIPDEKYRGD